MTEKHEYRGYTISIVPDPDPLNPRENQDHLCKMICWHRRYTLGDKHDQRYDSSREFWLSKMAEMHPDIPDDLDGGSLENWREKHYTFQMLYLYDHSGITISTTPFGCRWDSGLAGFIYCSLKDAAREFSSAEDWGAGVTYAGETTSLYQAVVNRMKYETQEYDEYLRGDAWGYVTVDENGNEVGSCWGFFGENGKDHAFSDAMNEVDARIRYMEKVEAQRIANGVYDI